MPGKVLAGLSLYFTSLHTGVRHGWGHMARLGQASGIWVGAAALKTCAGCYATAHVTLSSEACSGREDVGACSQVW